MSGYKATEYRSRKISRLMGLFRCPSCKTYFDESERVRVTKQKHRCKTCVEASKRQTRINMIRDIGERVQNAKV